MSGEGRLCFSITVSSIWYATIGVSHYPGFHFLVGTLWLVAGFVGWMSKR